MKKVIFIVGSILFGVVTINAENLAKKEISETAQTEETGTRINQGDIQKAVNKTMTKTTQQESPEKEPTRVVMTKEKS